MSNQKNGKLLVDVKRVMRLNHYSIHTERIYIDWIKKYVKFHKMDDRMELEGDFTYADLSNSNITPQIQLYEPH